MVKQIKLPYDYSDLEPVIDSNTMHLHYDKHHAGYTKKTNDTLKELKISSEDPKLIFANASTNKSIRNNGGGWWNHNFFFEALTKPETVKISTTFKKIIESNFGSYENFVTEFSNAAATQFGSGWAWLGRKSDGSLEIYSTANQDNSYMDINKISSTPILCLDVWEHAYYLQYNNRRLDYIKNYFRVINWELVEKRYNS